MVVCERVGCVRSIIFLHCKVDFRQSKGNYSLTYFIICRCNFIAESVCNIDILHANVGGFSLKPLV